MNRLKLLSIVLLILLVAACNSPEAKKQKFLDSGARYFAAKRYSEAELEYSRALQIDPTLAAGYEGLAKVYIETGNKLNAWQAYQRAAEMSPNDIELQIRAGGMLLVAQRFDDARRVAERILEKDPKNVYALVLRANSLVGLESMDTAIKLVEEAIQLAPQESDLYTNLASLQASSGQRADAEATYQRAIAAAPTKADAYLAFGNFYWATGRPQLAEQQLRKALELEPKNLLAHRAMATFYLGAGVPLKAEPDLKYLADSSGDIAHRVALADYYISTSRHDQGATLLEALAKNPATEADARTRLAALAYADGHHEQAAKSVVDVLAKFPRYAPALLLQARFALGRGQHDEALRLAVEATSARPDYVQALYLVGQLHAENGDYFQASEAYKALLRANPLATRAQIELSRTLYANGATDSADEYMTHALKRIPQDQNTRLLLVRALLERDDLATASTQLSALSAQYPSSPAVQSLLGTLNFRKRDYNAARTWYERALKTDPRLLDAISGLVGLDLAARRPADALRRVETALARAPRSEQLLLLQARTFGATGDFVKAEQTLRRVIDMHPDGFEGYGMLGQLLYDRGRLAEGRAEFQKLVALRPRAVPARTMLAVILRAEGKTDEAVDEYKKVIAIDPQSPVASNNLAWIYAERGVNLDEAVVLARAAKKRLPDVVEVTDTLGWVYYRNGADNLLSLAVPLLQEVVTKAPRNSLFRYHLGAAYARAERPQDARRELEDALKLSPDFHGAAESRRILATLK
ncbi:MAG: tetratricopeptide repeat protein [Vicinamibacterales bacterium]